jgi:hypothetical protein
VIALYRIMIKAWQLLHRIPFSFNAPIKFYSHDLSITTILHPRIGAQDARNARIDLFYFNKRAKNPKGIV